jgi:hypothetical protein
MFDLQIDKKKMSSMNEKKPTAHSQNMLHVDVLYTIKRKKYKTVCAELAFTKSLTFDTERKHNCDIELFSLFFQFFT